MGSWRLESLGGGVGRPSGWPVMADQKKIKQQATNSSSFLELADRSPSRLVSSLF